MDGALTVIHVDENQREHSQSVALKLPVGRAPETGATRFDGDPVIRKHSAHQGPDFAGDDQRKGSEESETTRITSYW